MGLEARNRAPTLPHHCDGYQCCFANYLGSSVHLVKMNRKERNRSELQSTPPEP
jgi:hypothetical protein